MAVWSHAASGVQGQSPWWGSRAMPPEADNTFVTMWNFEPVLRYVRDFMNQFNMK